MEKILVSACLIGRCCRYDGKSNAIPELVALAEMGLTVPVCPECDGGLATPRPPAEIQIIDGARRVINRDGEEVTNAYECGAAKALEMAKAQGCNKAILKSKSPSCGCGRIYDGTFSRTLIDGDGITAALLRAHGIDVMTEQSFTMDSSGR